MKRVSMQAVMMMMMMMGWALVGCYDDAWLLPEAEAVRIVREELELRGVDAGDTARVVAGLDVCVEGGVCRVVTLELDGWDEEARVGFAVVSAADRAGLQPSTRVEADEARAMQEQLDLRREAEGVVVVFRRWAHETDYLARDSFRRSVKAALDSRGLLEPQG